MWEGNDEGNQWVGIPPCTNFGREVGICLAATLEAVRIELAVGGFARSRGSRSDNFSSTSPSIMPSMTSSFFVLRTAIGAQHSSRLVVKIKEK